jgi:predicted amidohydrolase
LPDSLEISIATLRIQPYQAMPDFQAHVAGLAHEAASAGSALLLLPELTCLGLLWGDARAAETTVAGVAELYRRHLTPLFGASRSCLSEIAHSHGIVIAGASFWHEEAGQGRNTGFVAFPDGTLLRQDKIHPTRPEQAIGTSGGEAITAFELGGVRMGMAICYDVQFPELTRHLVAEEIDVLLVPSLTTERGYWRVRHAAHARAVENQIYVCVSPIFGDLGIPTDYPVVATGSAMVACPIDNRFGIADGSYARAKTDEEGLLNVTLDLARLRLSRDKSEIRQRADRRPDFYQSLKR